MKQCLCHATLVTKFLKRYSLCSTASSKLKLNTFWAKRELLCKVWAVFLRGHVWIQMCEKKSAVVLVSQLESNLLGLETVLGPQEMIQLALLGSGIHFTDSWHFYHVNMLLCKTQASAHFSCLLLSMYTTVCGAECTLPWHLCLHASSSLSLLEHSTDDSYLLLLASVNTGGYI